MKVITQIGEIDRHEFYQLMQIKKLYVVIPSSTKNGKKKKKN